MEIKNIYVIYNINRKNPPERISVNHVNDVNTRIVEIELRQGDEPVEISSDYTAKAAIVERRTKKLINDNILCTVNDKGNILIPVDDLHYRDKMDINVEVTITGNANGKSLTLPYPLWIRVNPSILDNAEVTDKSLGTIPELLEEAEELVENYHYVLTESEKQDIAALVDVSEKENSANKKTSISAQSQTGDNDTNFPTVGAVRNFVYYVKDDLEGYVEDYVDEALGGIENGSY